MRTSLFGLLVTTLAVGTGCAAPHTDDEAVGSSALSEATPPDIELVDGVDCLQDLDGDGVIDIVDDLFVAPDIETCRGTPGNRGAVVGDSVIDPDHLGSTLIASAPPPGAWGPQTLIESPTVPAALQGLVTAAGVHDLKYTGRFKCMHFSDVLEQILQLEGYEATVTLYWYTDRAGRRRAHAVVDVHLEDGTVLWFEPQSGRRVRMDRNADGEVNISDGGNLGRGNDEGGTHNVKVYDDLQSARDALNRPGWGQ